MATLDVIDGGRAAPRMWKCDECAKWSTWTAAHRWFGSLRDCDERRNVHITCSRACQRRAEGRGLVNDPGFRDV